MLHFFFRIKKTWINNKDSFSPEIEALDKTEYLVRFLRVLYNYTVLLIIVGYKGRSHLIPLKHIKLCMFPGIEEVETCFSAC